LKLKQVTNMRVVNTYRKYILFNKRLLQYLVVYSDTTIQQDSCYTNQKRLLKQSYMYVTNCMDIRV